LIPEYDIGYQFKTGENLIEFTPTETGSFRYSCWMGMIRGSITVIEEGAGRGAVPSDNAKPESDEYSQPSETFAGGGISSGDKPSGGEPSCH
jgi:hypothetical protein